jgi:hypothetical protein
MPFVASVVANPVKSDVFAFKVRTVFVKALLCNQLNLMYLLWLMLLRLLLS